MPVILYRSWRDFPPAQWRWPSFSPAELACRGTAQLMIDEPSLDKLQALRNLIGKPLIVNSAYRSPQHNAQSGGVKNSPHLRAIAFDISMANHDPAVFERPLAFDIHRKRIANLGFGLGPHRCLGMDVAKQEMMSAINGLMDRWPNMRLDPSKPRPVMIGFETRGMSALPVLLEG